MAVLRTRYAVLVSGDACVGSRVERLRPNSSRLNIGTEEQETGTTWCTTKPIEKPAGKTGKSTVSRCPPASIQLSGHLSHTSKCVQVIRVAL